MSSGVRCAGRVVDGGGRPVPHAFVMVVDGPVPVPEIALVTDDDGRFALTLPAGRWTVQARDEQRAGDAQVAVAAPDASVTIVIA
jgi:Carboxypeptidase regulatory-like domain